jgi:hypothetical protein
VIEWRTVSLMSPSWVARGPARFSRRLRIGRAICQRFGHRGQTIEDRRPFLFRIERLLMARSGHSSQRLLDRDCISACQSGGGNSRLSPDTQFTHSEAKSPTVSGGHLKYSRIMRWRPDTGFDLQRVAGAAVLIAAYSDIPDRLLHVRHVRLCWQQARRAKRGRIRPNRRRAFGNVTSPSRGEGCRTRRP